MSKIKSMTGYGRANFSVENLNFTVEITAVNQRGLAINISTPQDWAPLAERLISPLLKKSITRGKINLTVRLDNSAGITNSEAFSWDEIATQETLKALMQECKNVGIKFEATQELYLRIAELNRKKTSNFPSLEEPDIAKELYSAVETALQKFISMREQEGNFLKNDLAARIQKLKNLLEEIKKASQNTVVNYRDTLLTRLKTLNLEINLDDERFIKEITIFADRCDIAEECTRLTSHFQQFENCLEESDCGRKLDFICQEILRELNTIGSKANNIEITRAVIEAKNEQERIREQVQNIE